MTQSTIEESSQPLRINTAQVQRFLSAREVTLAESGGGGGRPGPATPPLSQPAPAPSLKHDGQIVHPRIWKHQAARARALHLNLSKILRDVLEAILDDPEAVAAYRSEQAAHQARVLEAGRTAAAQITARREAAVEKLRPRYDAWVERAKPGEKARVRWVAQELPYDRALRGMDPLDVRDALEARR